MKTCTKCGKTKPLSEFIKNKPSKDGVTYDCKACRREYRKGYYKRNKAVFSLRNRIQYERDKDRSKDRNLRNRYGITLADYQSMLTAQNEVCAICGGRNKNGIRLFVDHNHETKQVRGLLCNTCNAYLGHICDNEMNALRMYKYLAPMVTA